MQIHRVLVIILINTQSVLLAPLSTGSLINENKPSTKQPISYTPSIYTETSRRVSLGSRIECGVNSYGCDKVVTAGDIATPSKSIDRKNNDAKVNKEILEKKYNTELNSRNVKNDDKVVKMEDKGVKKEKPVNQYSSKVTKDVNTETSTNDKLFRFRNYNPTSDSSPIVNIENVSNQIVLLFTRTTLRAAPVLVKDRIKRPKTTKPRTTPLFGSSFTPRPIIQYNRKPNASGRYRHITTRLPLTARSNKAGLTTRRTATPRCYEKTIRPAPRVRSDPTSSTDIIWVGNTPPAR